MVLGYIANESRRCHVFVANRVQQIQDSTSVEQWRYVETKSNPADDASRGTGVRELLKSRWITGPDFLWKNEDQRPAAMHAKVPEKTTTYPSEHDPEVKKAVSMMTVTSTPEATLLSRIEYFSSWFRAKRSVALCIH